MKRNLPKALLLVCALMVLVGLPLQAQDAETPVIDRVWGMVTPCQDDNELVSVFLRVNNVASGNEIMLSAAESAIADAVMLAEADGTCATDRVENVSVPAGETLDLWEAGFVISVDPVEDYQGEPFNLNLTFDIDGEAVQAIVGVPILEEAPVASSILVDAGSVWARPTVMDAAEAEEMDGMNMGSTSAAYMRIMNMTDSDDALIAATSNITDEVEIHETAIDDNDVMSMRQVEGGIPLIAGETAMLQPGGFHIMFINPAAMAPGDTILLTLEFESGESVVLGVPVGDRMAGGMMMDMGDMDHDEMDDEMDMEDGEAMEDGTMTLNFVAMVGDEMATCGTSYGGIGADDASITFNDFRMYVSNIHLLTADGEAVPFELMQDGIWQQENVALLDFEDGTESCSDIGNAALNGEVIGMAPADMPMEEFVGLQFDLGVPFELNHQEVTAAASPLNIAAMWWNWQGGYKFIRVDLITDAIENSAYNIHIGSTGCESAAAVVAPEEPCSRPNVTTITFDAFDFDNNVIVADLGSLLDDIALYDSTPMPPGCMSGFDDPDCVGIYPAFGLSLETGQCLEDDCSGQAFFRVAAADSVTLIGRTDMMGMNSMNMDMGSDDHHDHDDDTEGEHNHGG